MHAHSRQRRKRTNELQVLLDLGFLADALATAGSDAEALEVAGMAEAHTADPGGSGPVWHVQGRDLVLDAADRLGPRTAADFRVRGRAVAAGYRVTRACSLARAARSISV